MANFDEDIRQIVNEMLEEEMVNKIIREKIKKGFEDAIDGAFRWGDLKKAIEKRVQEILVPYIEKYDMSRYITKLDNVLTDIVNQTSLQDNAAILKNFKHLMIEPDKKYISLSDIFEEYKQYVADNMETCGRNVECDEEPYYEPMSVTAEIVREEEMPWRSFEHATLELAVTEEDQQKELNFSIPLSRWKHSTEDKGYSINYETDHTIRSIARLEEFEIYLLRLMRAGIRLLDDVQQEDDMVIATDRPEAVYE